MAIFPRASLIVHQGGIGILAQSLAAQRPVLVVPFGFDQFDNGERVEKLGIGKTISRNHFTIEAALPIIEELLKNPSYQRNAIKMGQTINIENGMLSACEAIEHLINKITNS